VVFKTKTGVDGRLLFGGGDPEELEERRRFSSNEVRISAMRSARGS